jgi:hypothetical protein
MGNPGQAGPTHWNAAEHVLRYLKSSINLGIIYSAGGDVDPIGYSDSDWGQDPNTQRSISGSVFLMADASGPISWRSKKQTTVALSSMEAEYVAESLAVRQVLWLRSLITELGNV